MSTKSTDWPQGYDLICLKTTDSTMREAARRANQTSTPTWIRADQQTDAYGRRGRAWVNPASNLAATLLMRTDMPPQQTALRSFVASLALFDAISTVTGRATGLALKWPNDVLLNGGKVAGILLESLGAQGKVAHLSIGIGVNLAEAPTPDVVEARAVPPVSLLSETGTHISANEFLEFLANAYARWETQFVTYGFAPIQTAWLARAARLGDVITARTGTDEITGTFETVDEQGNLVLSTPKGRRAIAAAEVFF